MKSYGIVALLVLLSSSGMLASENESAVVGATDDYVRIGDFAFRAQEVRFETGNTTSDKRQIRCTLSGNAQLLLFDGDIKLAADNIQLESVGDKSVSVRCSGTCKYSEADDGLLLSGDKLHFDGGISVSGNATVVLGKGSGRTTVRADSITAQNGELKLTGNTRIQLYKNE